MRYTIKEIITKEKTIYQKYGCFYDNYYIDIAEEKFKLIDYNVLKDKTIQVNLWSEENNSIVQHDVIGAKQIIKLFFD